MLDNGHILCRALFPPFVFDSILSGHGIPRAAISGEASVRDSEQWFFFCPRQEREAQGGRPTRTTQYGYWKATGSPTQVIHEGRNVGKRTTMVFYEGRPPSGRKTSWKMNEYTAYDETSTPGATPTVKSYTFNWAGELC